MLRVTYMFEFHSFSLFLSTLCTYLYTNTCVNKRVHTHTQTHTHRATVPWETTDHQDVRRQWENILKEESFLQKTLSRVEAEISAGVIVATEGKARLPDGAISVQWKNGHVFRYYHSLDGGTRYPLAHAPRAASTPLHLGETKPEKGSWTLVLGLNAFSKPGEADRQQEAQRHRDIVKRCLKNMTYTIVMKCFRKLKSYKKPASFCLITLQRLESEDDFYEPGIQDVFQGCVAEKRQEDWMAELCSNATDPSWIEARKKEEAEKENEHRRKSLYMKKLGMKANQVKLKAESPFPPSTVTGTPATGFPPDLPIYSSKGYHQIYNYLSTSVHILLSPYILQLFFVIFIDM